MDGAIPVLLFVLLAAYLVFRQRYYRQGLARYKAQDYDSAIRAYEKAIRLHPRDAGAYYNRGLMLFQKGKVDAAISDFNRSLQFKPRHDAAHHMRGLAFGLVGRLDQALMDFDAALRLNPDADGVYINQADLHYALGNTAIALEGYNTAIRMIEERLDKISRYGVYLRGGKEQLPALHTRLAMAYFRRGIVHGDNASDFERSIEIVQQLLALAPDTLEAYVLEGAIYTHNGEHNESLAAYEKALRLSPDNWTIYNDRGEAYFKAGEYEQARADFEKALALSSEVRFSLAGLAVTLHALGKVDEAILAWKSRQAEEPRYGNAEWVGRRLFWTEPLVEEARKLIARLDADS